MVSPCLRQRRARRIAARLHVLRAWRYTRKRAPSRAIRGTMRIAGHRVLRRSRTPPRALSHRVTSARGVTQVTPDRTDPSHLSCHRSGYLPTGSSMRTDRGARIPGSRQWQCRRGRGIAMHTWAPYNPEDHRMSARRLLSAWSMVALCALAVAVLSPISGTETSDHVTMTGGAQHYAAPSHVSRVSEIAGDPVMIRL